MAHQRVPADNGDRHPDHRLPDAAIHPAVDLHRGDDVVHDRHPRRRPRAGLRTPDRRPRGAGVRHRAHGPAADDDDPERRLGAESWPHDGTGLHRDRRRAGRRSDGVRPDPAVPQLASHVLDRAAHRDRCADPRRGVRPQRHRTSARAARPHLGPVVGSRLRRCRLRSQQHRGVGGWARPDPTVGATRHRRRRARVVRRATAQTRRSRLGAARPADLRDRTVPLGRRADGRVHADALRRTQSCFPFSYRT